MAETRERLTVILYTGSKGVEDYKTVDPWSKTVGCEKGFRQMEIAIDRMDIVHNLDLPPQFKIFPTAPKLQVVNLLQVQLSRCLNIIKRLFIS